jgi:hypothetical protein
MTTDEELARMKLGEALRWAADGAGFLRLQSRLERLARVRGYKSGWIAHVYGQHWHQVWERCLHYRTDRRFDDDD